MKVLQVGLSFNPGGIESFVMTYYRELSKKGVRFDFISMFPHLAYEEEIKSLGGKVFHTCDARKHPLKFSRQMRKILRIGRYNAVCHASAGFPFRIVSRAILQIFVKCGGKVTKIS